MWASEYWFIFSNICSNLKLKQYNYFQSHNFQPVCPMNCLPYHAFFINEIFLYIFCHNFRESKRAINSVCQVTKRASRTHLNQMCSTSFIFHTACIFLLDSQMNYQMNLIIFIFSLFYINGLEIKLVLVLT